MGLSVFDAGLPQFINGSPVDSHLNLLFHEACFYTNGLRPRLGKTDDFLSRKCLNVDPVGLPGYFFLSHDKSLFNFSVYSHRMLSLLLKTKYIQYYYDMMAVLIISPVIIYYH